MGLHIFFAVVVPKQIYSGQESAKSIKNIANVDWQKPQNFPSV